MPFLDCPLPFYFPYTALNFKTWNCYCKPLPKTWHVQKLGWVHSVVEVYKFPEQGLLSECPCVNIDVTHLTTNSPWKIHHGQQQTFIELIPGPRGLVSHSKKWVNLVMQPNWHWLQPCFCRRRRSREGKVKDTSAISSRMISHQAKIQTL